jgi:fluoroquinolone transport system ATP-binding protein
MIQVQNLTYSYPGTEKQVLKDISFEIKEGEIFGFLGPSGAGKSTTQKVLNGLLKGFGGSVHINGTDLSKMERSFYEKIGVAFEFPNLYLKLTALENLQLFASFFVNSPPEATNYKLILQYYEKLHLPPVYPIHPFSDHCFQ